MNICLNTLHNGDDDDNDNDNNNNNNNNFHKGSITAKLHYMAL
jgi:hypothetical protein